MSNKQLYRQCELIKQIEGGHLIDVAFIPSNFAKVGKTLSLKMNDELSESWMVSAVYDSMTFDDLQIQRWAEKRWKNCLGNDVRD